jgi:hypothetical protein
MSWAESSLSEGGQGSFSSEKYPNLLAFDPSIGPLVLDGEFMFSVWKHA